MRLKQLIEPKMVDIHDQPVAEHFDTTPTTNPTTILKADRMVTVIKSVSCNLSKFELIFDFANNVLSCKQIGCKEANNLQ